MQIDTEEKEVRILLKSESLHVCEEQEEVNKKCKMSRKLLLVCLCFSGRK